MQYWRVSRKPKNTPKRLYLQMQDPFPNPYSSTGTYGPLKTPENLKSSLIPGVIAISSNSFKILNVSLRNSRNQTRFQHHLGSTRLEYHRNVAFISFWLFSCDYCANCVTFFLLRTRNQQHPGASWFRQRQIWIHRIRNWVLSERFWHSTIAEPRV